MIKKIKNKYYKYRSYRSNGEVKTEYLGRATWFDMLIFKIKDLRRLFSEQKVPLIYWEIK